MTNNTTRSLRVFLCHASGDKPDVQKLYSRLINDGVDAWLDKEKLLPGQNWQIEIPKAVRNSDVVIVCLSEKSLTKEGFVQKEIKIALDTSDEKPEETIFIIPARLEDCEIPERISAFHCVDLYSDGGYERLLKALQIRANNLGIVIKRKKKTNKTTNRNSINNNPPKGNSLKTNEYIQVTPKNMTNLQQDINTVSLEFKDISSESIKYSVYIDGVSVGKFSDSGKIKTSPGSHEIYVEGEYECPSFGSFPLFVTQYGKSNILKKNFNGHDTHKFVCKYRTNLILRNMPIIDRIFRDSVELSEI